MLRRISKVIFFFLILIAIWEVILRELFFKFVPRSFPSQTYQTSNLVFNQLDVDSSGHLSFEEWVPYFSQSSGENVDPRLDAPLYVSDNLLDDRPHHLEEKDSILTLKASFLPLLLNSTMKNFTEENNVHPGSMLGLLNWQMPIVPWKNFAARQFEIFLPPKEIPLSAGHIWWIVAPQRTLQLSSSHYEPPPVNSKLVFLRDLFKIFHHRPSLLTRFPPQGTAAVIRAVGKDMVDIRFRSHVEFQLNEKPALPFWFTPAQFQGHLIIHRNATHVDYFSMLVPSSRPLNVDMEWLYGTNSHEMEVDLGFVPEMKLESTSPSVPATQLGDFKSLFIHGMHSDRSGQLPKHRWLDEISEHEAWSLLERRFFAFKNVPYYNITEVFDRAEEQNKLVHTLVLFGSLDDQSC